LPLIECKIPAIELIEKRLFGAPLPATFRYVFFHTFFMPLSSEEKKILSVFLECDCGFILT